MIGLLRLFVLAILLLPAFFGSVSAALVDLTWTGATFGGNDGIGLFGPVGTIPADILYTARYRFDTSISYSENLTNGSQQVSGGTFYSPSPPIPLISADVTINGVTVAGNGAYDSVYFRETGQGVSHIKTNAIREPSSTIAGEIFQQVFRLGNFYTLPLDQPGEFDFNSLDSPGGEFLQSNRDGQGNILAQTQIFLVPSHLSITLAVPELASFTYAVCGAIGVGQVFGRRRSSGRGRHC